MSPEELKKLQLQLEESRRLRSERGAYDDIFNAAQSFNASMSGNKYDPVSDRGYKEAGQDVTRLQGLVDRSKSSRDKPGLSVSKTYQTPEGQPLWEKSSEIGLFTGDGNKYSGPVKKITKDSKGQSTASTRYWVKGSHIPVVREGGRYYYTDENGNKTFVSANTVEQVPATTNESQKKNADRAQDKFERLPKEANKFNKITNRAYRGILAIEQLLVGQHSGFWDTILSKFGKYMPGDWANLDQAEFKQRASILLSTYIKDMSGTAASSSEVERLSQYIPTADDDDDVFARKLAVLKGELRATRNDEVAYYKNAKYNTSLFDDDKIWKEDYALPERLTDKEKAKKKKKKEKEKAKYKTGQIVKRQRKFYVRTAAGGWKKFSTKEDAKVYSNSITGKGL